MVCGGVGGRDAVLRRRGEKGCCGCALGFAGGGGLDEGEDKGLRVWGGGGVEGGIRIRLRLVGWHGC